MHLRAAALPPAVLAVVLMAPGGCAKTGKSDTSKLPADQKAPAQAVYDLRDAVVKRDEAKICNTYLTSALKNQLAAAAKSDKRGVTCEDQVKASIQDIDSTDLTITKVQIDPAHPSTATVSFTTKVSHGTAPTDTLTLADEHGWRVSKLP